MTCNVVILKSARYEYESIVGYLAQILKNPRAAGNYVAEFEYQLDLLREQPFLRPLSHMQELASRNYRSFHGLVAVLSYGDVALRLNKRGECSSVLHISDGHTS